LKAEVKEIGTDVKGIEFDVKEFESDIKEFKEEFRVEVFSSVLMINTMYSTMEKILEEQSKSAERIRANDDNSYQMKINKIFKVSPLRFTDYKETNVIRQGRVTRYVDIRNEAHEFAFKTIFDIEDRNSIQNQVTILKELKDMQNIIKFYGLANCGNKWCLVTEWAEFGNLREFYTNYKERFDLKLKLRISLDIARGLNFLRSVEVYITVF